MPKLYSGKEIEKRLIRLGFEEVSQKGSHLKMTRTIKGRRRVVIIPMHKEVALGTLKSVLRQAGISKEVLDGAK
ncbi:hypothetical protein A3D09_02375 [Candidatus Collierbacteria bacterium RIFCSPHIGHO2_02_FULL_49_10]|uniref:Addiction module toxin, HicA family n=1 Tax=Candidatus Collierbacteria bacterium RIFCSPHIGHO2_02_FULL_49_10 TaxID=1817723 RepID=A0A1F5ER47_9BACT|nr:MAG: hypothetical protein A3D09_02375 [Candidatus Collierbacteria bacterium RIFCSPHIGHO2_02_FULL_49_10]